METALVTIFCTSFVLALSGALMPGPLLTVTVSESSRRGMSTGPLMIFGHGLLELALIVALVSGLAPILARNDVFILISLTGGAVLLWMGVSMLGSLPGLTLDCHASSKKSRNLVVMGIVLSAVNPYWLIWWASIGLSYIMHSLKFGILGVTAFFLGHILADLAWYTLISFGIAKGKHLFSDKFYRKMIGGCGIFLILFSCWFFSFAFCFCCHDIFSFSLF
jgi:threonine/homoserine/homoserine lactone efflux protein